MRDSLQKVAAGVVVAIVVNKITPYVEETVDKLIEKKTKKNAN